MTFQELRQLFESIDTDHLIQYKRVAIFDTITVQLSHITLVLTYNQNMDQLKVQVDTYIEVLNLSETEPWLLRYRLITMCMGAQLDTVEVDLLTKDWEAQQ